MTNAEYCIKNGIKFADISAISLGFSLARKADAYGILSADKTVIGQIFIYGGSESYALRYWLDMEHEEKAV